MPDSYSIKLVGNFGQSPQAWEALRVIASIIEHVTPGGRPLKEGTWELSFEGRRWTRESNREVEVLAAGMGIESYTVYWNYVVQGLQWSLTGRFWGDGRATIEADAYAGRERMSTEEAVRLVVREASERGITLHQDETQISSTEGRTKVPSVPLAINHKPIRKWAIFRVWAGPHLASYAVNVLATVTAAYLLIKLGLGN